MKITWKVLLVALGVAIAVSLSWWTWSVMHQFTVADPWEQLPPALANTFKVRELRPIGFWSLVVGFGPVGLVLWFLDQLDDKGKPRVLRGPEIVTAQKLDRLTRERRGLFSRKAPRAQITVAGVALPAACEPWHVFVVGSTGSGKTTAYDEMIACARARGDRLIVVDPNGHALARFGMKGDQLLNPFDQRGNGWNPFNEIRVDSDYEWLARSIVPDASDTGQQAWHGYAQQLLAATMRAMAQIGEVTTERLIYWLTQAPTGELAKLLAGTTVARQFERGSEKALGSTLFILAAHLAPFQHLRAGDFSVRRWLEEGQGNLYITWWQTQLAILRPLVSAWTDLVISTTLTLSENAPRPLWLMLDELGSLGRLTSLVDGLTKGRKHGLRVVAGLQASAQLDSLYGVKDATTLRSCFRTLLALACSSSDPETAKMLSEALGTRMVEHEVKSRNGRGEVSITRAQRTEHAVLASELTNLPQLAGFLKVAGDFPVGRVQLTRREYVQRLKAFVAVKPC
jgi:type IV secretory pathway TraG/TraD family ATPase VirD4